jgi:hypothetical protein
MFPAAEPNAQWLIKEEDIGLRRSVLPILPLSETHILVPSIGVVGRIVGTLGVIFDGARAYWSARPR